MWKDTILLTIIVFGVRGQEGVRLPVFTLYTLVSYFFKKKIHIWEIKRILPRTELQYGLDNKQ